MKKKSKALLVLLSAVALVVATMLGTMAYLTDTESVKNTFTVGKVGITLDELNVDGKDAAGKENKNETRDVANKYHLIPGQTYDKDPTVTMDSDSELSYVYMTVTVNGYNDLTAALPKTIVDANNAPVYYVGDVFLLQNLCDWQANSDWQYKGAKENANETSCEYRFAYKTAVDGTAGKLPALFNTITVPGADITSQNIDKLDDVEIIVNAYAVQAAGFNNYNEAWKAAFGSNIENYDIPTP